MFEKFLAFAAVNITILIKQSMILIYDINKTVKHWQWDWSVVNRTHKQLSELFLVEGNNTSKNCSCCFSKRRQRGGVCMQNNTLRHYGNRKERGREKVGDRRTIVVDHDCVIVSLERSPAWRAMTGCRRTKGRGAMNLWTLGRSCRGRCRIMKLSFDRSTCTNV